MKIPKISWEFWLKILKSHQTIIIIKITKLMAIHISWFNLWDQIRSALTIIPHQELRSHFWVILRMEWSLQEKFDRSWPHLTLNVHGPWWFNIWTLQRSNRRNERTQQNIHWSFIFNVTRRSSFEFQYFRGSFTRWVLELLVHIRQLKRSTVQLEDFKKTFCATV